MLFRSRNNFQVDDVELACTLIPAKIKYAQYELARALANDKIGRASCRERVSTSV